MFGKRILELRNSKEMTQTQLAKTLGISRSALSLYEIEKREPDINTLNKIAKLFNVPVGYITGNQIEGYMDNENVCIDMVKESEILHKQLELLAEKSQNCTLDLLPRITEQMVVIYSVIKLKDYQWN
jgi:transcriptional regulator with XRE-family HTH domain